MTGAELTILQLIITKALENAPAIIALMRADAAISLEDMMPTPRAVQEQMIREREGLADAPE